MPHPNKLRDALRNIRSRLRTAIGLSNEVHTTLNHLDEDLYQLQLLVAQLELELPPPPTE